MLDQLQQMENVLWDIRVLLIALLVLLLIHAIGSD